MQSGYDTVKRETLTGRALEREVLTRITGRMRRGLSAEAGARAGLIGAVEENRRFWLALATDLAQSGNAHADEVKAGLISLAGFVERHTGQVLLERAGPNILIEVNQAIIAGLGPAETKRSAA